MSNNSKIINDNNVQRYLPFKPVILCLLPICWIVLNEEQYAVSFYNSFIDSIWWLLVPAILAAALLYSKNFYLVLLARALAVIQLGWAKVFLAEIKKDRDILLEISDVIKIRRIWSQNEIQDKVKMILNDYSIKAEPRVLTEIAEKCNGSIVEAIRLTESFASSWLNPPAWKTVITFLSHNALPLGLTVISAVITAQIYKWWQSPGTQLTEQISIGAQNTAELARVTSLKISDIDVAVRHHSRIIDQQNQNISSIENDLSRMVTGTIQPEIRQLAVQDTKLSEAVDKLNTTAVGMDFKIRQNENTLLGMSHAIAAIKRAINIS